MITRKLLTASFLTLFAVVSVVSVNATAMAQGVTRRPAKVTDHRNTSKPPPRAPNFTDHRNKPKPPPRASGVTDRREKDITFKKANKIMARYKQWMIGANETGHVLPRPAGSRIGSYNIKGKVIRKFLQYEKQGTWRGINLGWTNNASATTATKRAKWFFRRRGDQGVVGAIPLKYGEVVALGWGTKDKPYVKYSKRNIGINLNWSKTPSYEWTILGGRPGTKIKRGEDWVIIYNLKHKYPMMYFDRQAGGDIGWPDSQRWEIGTGQITTASPFPRIVKPLMR